MATAAAPGTGTDCGGVVDRAAATAAAAALATSMFELTLPRHMADAGTLYSRRLSLAHSIDNPLFQLCNSPLFLPQMLRRVVDDESREMSRRPTSVRGSGREVNVIGPSITLYYEVGREESLLASEQSEIHSGNGARGAAISGRKPDPPLSSRSASSARAAAPVVVRGAGAFRTTLQSQNQIPLSRSVAGPPAIPTAADAERAAEPSDWAVSTQTITAAEAVVDRPVVRPRPPGLSSVAFETDARRRRLISFPPPPKPIPQPFFATLLAVAHWPPRRPPRRPRAPPLHICI